MTHDTVRREAGRQGGVRAEMECRKRNNLQPPGGLENVLSLSPLQEGAQLLPSNTPPTHPLTTTTTPVTSRLFGGVSLLQAAHIIVMKNC